MYFYHHYLQKGYELEYLFDLGFYSKKFMTASMDIELDKENKRMQLQEQILKNSGGALPVLSVQI